MPQNVFPIFVFNPFLVLLVKKLVNLLRSEVDQLRQVVLLFKHLARHIVYLQDYSISHFVRIMLLFRSLVLQDEQLILLKLLKSQLSAQPYISHTLSFEPTFLGISLALRYTALWYLAFLFLIDLFSEEFEIWTLFKISLFILCFYIVWYISYSASSSFWKAACYLRIILNGGVYHSGLFFDNVKVVLQRLRLNGLSFLNLCHRRFDSICHLFLYYKVETLSFYRLANSRKVNDLQIFLLNYLLGEFLVDYLGIVINYSYCLSEFLVAVFHSLITDLNVA